MIIVSKIRDKAHFYSNKIKINWRKKKKTYGGTENFSMDEVNIILKQKIIKNEPIAVCRCGFAELNFLDTYHKDVKNGTTKVLDTNIAPLFQYDLEKINKFELIMKNAYIKSNILCNWYVTNNEEKIIKRYECNALSTMARIVEPYYFDHPWTSALKGKKVLVISPFTEIIGQQYKKRKLLFENEDILPEFDLLLLKSVWYLGNDESIFKDWFEAYDYLYNKAMEIEFDIVLLSCGPFGFPLATRFKEAGKQAIHMGGALQIMFGIKGNRWDKNPFFNKMYNGNWVRASKEEAPINPQVLDNCCYW